MHKAALDSPPWRVAIHFTDLKRQYLIHAVDAVIGIRR